MTTTSLDIRPASRRLLAGLDAGVFIICLAAFMFAPLPAWPSWVYVLLAAFTLGTSMAWRVMRRKVRPSDAARQAMRALKMDQVPGPSVIFGLSAAIALNGLAALMVGGSTVQRVQDHRAEAATGGWVGVFVVVGIILGAGLGEELMRAGLAHRLAVAFGSSKQYPWWSLTASTMVWASAHWNYAYRPPEIAAVVGIGMILAWVFRKDGLWSAVILHIAIDLLAVFF